VSLVYLVEHVESYSFFSYSKSTTRRKLVTPTWYEHATFWLV